MRAIKRLPACAVALAVLTVATFPTGAWSQTSAPAGYEVVKTAPLHSGVEYVKLAKAAGPVVTHIAHLLPGAPVDLQVVNANDRIPASAKDLETTSSMCRRVHCIAGVNGDFHKLGVPAGAVVVDGRLLHSPEPGRPQLSVTKDGRLVAGLFDWMGSLTANGGQAAVTTVNAAPPANELAVFTPEYGPGTDESSRVELVVRASRVGALNKPTNLELVSLRTGGGPIPPDGAVLSGDGAAGQHLRDLWGQRPKATGPVRLLISSPIDADVSVGVEPVVLRDGKRALPWRDPNVINPRQPHTLIGWNKEGHIYLVAVDGRQAASEGVSMAEAADFLTSLGVTDAVSLDGGGGTVFVADGSVWNRPSDNDPARPDRYVERGAPNAFVLVARPGSQAAPDPAPATGSRPGAIKPMSAAPEPAAGDPDQSGLDSAPWSTGPMTLEGETALISPEIGLTAELSVGRSASHPVPGAANHGHEATPTDPDASAAATEDARSLTTQASSHSVDGPNQPRSSDDNLLSALSVSTASPDQPAGTGRRGPQPLSALLGGTALATVAGLATRTQRRRRNTACVLGPPERRETGPQADPLPVEASEACRLFRLTPLHDLQCLALDARARASLTSGRR